MLMIALVLQISCLDQREVPRSLRFKPRSLCTAEVIENLCPSEKFSAKSAEPSVQDVKNKFRYLLKGPLRWEALQKCHQAEIVR